METEPSSDYTPEQIAEHNRREAKATEINSKRGKVIARDAPSGVSSPEPEPAPKPKETQSVKPRRN